MKKLSKNKIDKISRCYEGLGAQTYIRNADISYFLCPFWRNSVMTPIFINQTQFDSKLLVMIENYFKRNIFKDPFCSNMPYLNLVQDSYFDLNKIRVQVKNGGWNYRQKNPMWVCVWEKPMPLQIPKGYSFRVGKYFDPELYKDFHKIMRETFMSSDIFMANLDKLHRKINQNVHLVIIYNSKSIAVGGGLVASGKHGSYLYCGAISKRYRRRGLWKFLVAARQSVSMKSLDHAWVMTTRHLHLTKSSDWSRKMLTLSKIVNSESEI